MGASKAATIAAIATAPGRGGVGVVRISGPDTASIAEQLCLTTLQARYASLNKFIDKDGVVIDKGIALWFPKPNSFTGEDVLELQAHGGRLVLKNLLQRVIDLGARLANPGEFTERAFLNGKLDLTQAEAVADLIDAESIQAARSAVRSLQGEFSKKIHNLVAGIIKLRANIEAHIDFPEEDITPAALEQLQADLQAVLQALQLLQNSAQQGVLLREGITVVIAGEPNVGKSSLLNQLSGQESAIVAATPGTTRDIVKEYIQLDGMPLHILDTAGLRDSADHIECEGIRRAKQAITQADKVLLVVDSRTTTTASVRQQWQALFDEVEIGDKITVIFNKIDLSQQPPQLITEDKTTMVSLSAATGNGVELLKQHLEEYMGFNVGVENDFIARSRHVELLSAARQALFNAQQQLQQSNWELVAEELRLAQQQFNQITGEFYTDDLLATIFSEFCIGK